MRFASARPVDLVAANALALLVLVAAWALPDSPLRVALGLPFILFVPGYLLVAALFPERAEPQAEGGKRGLDALERVALSFGLSIAVVPLLGLALNFTPWGIRLAPLLATLTLWTVGMSALAWWRRERLAPERRLAFALDVAPPAWRAYGPLDKALTVGLALAVLTAGGALAYVATAPREGEAFTEFYVLGPGGKAEGYPTRLAPGANASVIVGIVNHENEDVSYAVRATLTPGALVVNETGARRFEPSGPPEPFQNVFTGRALALADGEKLEETLVVTAPPAAGVYRLGLDLERAGAANAEGAYRSLHLWVTVEA